jgi:hypothetical protein
MMPQYMSRCVERPAYQQAFQVNAPNAIKYVNAQMQMKGTQKSGKPFGFM